MSRNNLVLKLVYLVMLASLILAACAPASTEAPAEEATEAAATEATTEAATEAPAEPPVELTYTYPGAIPSDVASVEAALSEITLEKFNATIKLNPVDWGAYTDKVNLMVAAGEGCDILFVAPWMSPSYSQLVSTGALYPLNDLLAGVPELVESMPAGALDATAIDGVTYGIPNQQIWVKPFGPIVRSDLAEKYAFDISTVTKLEDLEPYLAAVKAGEADVYPSTQGVFRNELFGWDPIVSEQAGVVVKYDDAGLAVINAYETAEFAAFAELMRKWYEAGYFPNDAVTEDELNADWKAGKYGASLLAVVKPGLSADMHQVFAEAKASHYLVFITGPSRTADIELTVTLGVHGPKNLYVWMMDK